MRHGDLAVLVAALLLVRHLVFDLQRAGARLDHLLGEQIGRLGIAEARVDVRNDRDDVGFVVVDRVLQPLGFGRVARFARCIQIAEHSAQLTRVSLLEEGVYLLDQLGHGSFLVHRLVGQGPEFAAQRGNHPARQIEVAALGAAEMLLDRDHLLLADKAVPRAQRLGVVRRIGVVGIHIFAHDLCGVLRDVEPGAEAVLQAHAGSALGIDRGPGVTALADAGLQVLGFACVVRIAHWGTP